MIPIPVLLQLASLAPTVMRYFGAGEPSVAVADKIVDVARQVTGTSTPEQAVAALQADPGKVIEFQERLIAVDAELEQAFLKDRQDARARDVALAQAGRTNTRANAMVALDAIGLIACLVVLVAWRDQMPGEVVGIISTIAGIFGLCLRDAHQFEFGSSRGSRDKDQLLALVGRTNAGQRTGGTGD